MSRPVWAPLQEDSNMSRVNNSRQLDKTVVWCLLLCGGVGFGFAEEVTATGSTQDQCSAKGLQGECNGCVCCCYSGGGGLVNYKPDKCDCKRSWSQPQILVSLALSLIVAVPSIIASCYFSGRCGVTPYKPQPHNQRLPTQQVIELAPIAAPTRR